ncbi:unnamed protein product, partial [Ascophyllum nodosum]
RQQTHLNFAASHESRNAARLRNSSSSGLGKGGVDGTPPEESASLFNDNFNTETKDISDSLEKLVAESKQQASTGAGLPVAEHGGSPNAALVDEKEIVRTQLDALVDRVKGLRKLTAEGALFLPLYELRRAQEEVGKLLAMVESTRAELAPRKKFAFRSRNRMATGQGMRQRPPLPSPAMADASTGVAGTGADLEGDDGPGLRGLNGQDVEVPAGEAHGKDFNLADLHMCTVRILPVLGALRVRRLTSSRVVCGAVKGPIYVEGCKDCVMLFAGRQLRVHDSQDVDLYVLVSSGPVIEDCRGLRFAPWRAQNPQHRQQLQANNAWEEVKDFKWHRAQKSPNWEVIAEAER